MHLFSIGQQVVVNDPELWSRKRNCIVFKDDGRKTVGVCTTDGLIGWATRECITSVTDARLLDDEGRAILMSLARMAIGNAKDEAFEAVRHQVQRMYEHAKGVGDDKTAEILRKILAEGPSQSRGGTLRRSLTES